MITKGLSQNRLLRAMKRTTSLWVVLFTPKLQTVCNFSVNIDFLDFMPTLVRNFAVNFAILDFTSMPMHSFAVNIDILDFALSVSTKERCCIDPATI
jgi:hypothetical protein